MNKIRIKWAAPILSLTALVALPLHSSADPLKVNAPLSTNTSRITFDSKTSLGGLFWVNPRGERVAIGKARGTVLVPKTNLVLEVSYDVIEHPEMLDSIPDVFFEILSRNSEEDMSKLIPHLPRLTQLRALELQYAILPDAAAKPVGRLTNLERIDLRGTGINGSCFQNLQSLVNLRYLNVAYNPLKSDGLRYIMGLPKLQLLAINMCHITDAELAIIAKPDRIDDLNLSENPAITDRGLLCFKSSKKLKSLFINRTRISANGVIALKDTPLKHLVLPLYPLIDQQRVRAAFPHTDIEFAKDKLTTDMRQLFAPMHDTGPSGYN